LLFQQDFIYRVEFAFSQSNWLHSDQFQLFQQWISFPLMALKIEDNAKFTSLSGGTFGYKN